MPSEGSDRQSFSVALIPALALAVLATGCLVTPVPIPTPFDDAAAHDASTACDGGAKQYDGGSDMWKGPDIPISFPDSGVYGDGTNDGITDGVNDGITDASTEGGVEAGAGDSTSFQDYTPTHDGPPPKEGGIITDTQHGD